MTLSLRPPGSSAGCRDPVPTWGDRPEGNFSSRNWCEPENEFCCRRLLHASDPARAARCSRLPG